VWFVRPRIARIAEHSDASIVSHKPEIVLAEVNEVQACPDG
jgi:hypothetical protein